MAESLLFNIGQAFVQSRLGKFAVWPKDHPDRMSVYQNLQVKVKVSLNGDMERAGIDIVDARAHRVRGGQDRCRTRILARGRADRVAQHRHRDGRFEPTACDFADREQHASVGKR